MRVIGRISAVLGLRYTDVSLERTPDAPHGTLAFRASTDKRKVHWLVAMNPTARAAIERVLVERPGIGEAPLFPAPGNPSEPVSEDRADKWLRRAEKLAGLTPQKGSLWHAYRRGFATRLKHLPAQDVAQAGGWKSVEVVREIYQQADAETTRAAMMAADPLTCASNMYNADGVGIEEAEKPA